MNRRTSSTEMIFGSFPKRVMENGARALSSAEILANLIGSVSAAQELLQAGRGSLRSIAMMSVDRIAAVKGIGQKKAALVLAALEVGRRFACESREEGAAVRWPRDVFELMSPKLEDCPVEEFHILILDSQHRVERDVMVTRGLLNSSLVHPREVFREAITSNAAAIILVHNHPSGDPTPSGDDRAVTEQLVAAGRLLDLPVQDHIIIGRGRYISFAEAGLL